MGNGFANLPKPANVLKELDLLVNLERDGELFDFSFGVSDVAQNIETRIKYLLALCPQIDLMSKDSPFREKIIEYGKKYGVSIDEFGDLA
ncbi:MAG: hypothetical protein AABX93_02000 [Nanoarchaeota archaeon]